MDLPPLLLLLGILWLLWEVLSFFAIALEIPSASRAIYHKVRGQLVVPTPEDLLVAAANGLIRPGQELIVGLNHEGSDGEVTRFAIHPSIVGRPIGTRLSVVSIHSKRLVLRKNGEEPKVTT
jgi:hypothetical protein